MSNFGHLRAFLCSRCGISLFLVWKRTGFRVAFDENRRFWPGINLALKTALELQNVAGFPAIWI